MSNIKVSVIIPVYNVEPYLRECLDSVINQTLKEIEIICIDDCSTDNSYKILEEYAEKDNRIIILKNEKNTGGPSTARNKGIELSKGTYIGFIDADDYIKNDYIKNLYDTITKYDTDIVSTLNVYYINENNDITYSWYNINKHIKNKNKLEGKSNINIKQLKYNSEEYPYLVCWNKLYKKTSIINNGIKFMPYYDGKDDGSEDNHFFYQILMENLTFSYNHNAIYYQRILNNSLSRSKISLYPFYKRIFDILNRYSTNDDNDNIERIKIIMFNDFYSHFTFYKNIDKIKEYNNINKLANQLILNETLMDKLKYYKYMLIKLNNKYENFLLNSFIFDDLNYVKNKIDLINDNISSKIIFFGIYNMHDKIIIYFFGIKITIKKKK
ncbi:glycosyltransferase family 2 protein [Brachyspira sp. SAP_772]|uniref:glycosyltransferase family 2 protein n=1 Tax=Brachyspira sp. SAP_772 TaxID=2608385 RepID=UPI0012F4E049|nr:glycosyltransferase family 2 protein [Brachyspira sp. SAP_772]